MPRARTLGDDVHRCLRTGIDDVECCDGRYSTGRESLHRRCTGDQREITRTDGLEIYQG